MSSEYKFPKTLGACADRYYKLRNERLAIQRKAKEVEAEEKALKEHIINTLPKSEAMGVAGKVARVTVVTKQIPIITDFQQVQEYVRKNASKGAFALLQRRLNAAAVQELWDAGKAVPGVEPYNAITLSVNKL